MHRKMATFFYQENNDPQDDAFKSSSSSTSSSSSDVSIGAVSSDSDLFEEEEEVNSSSSSSPTSVSTRSKDSLHDMSSLLQVLPLKRGLSKHYNGKSQSFGCLSNLRCFEDLAKPEKPCNKKIKSCKSYQDFDDDENHGSNIMQNGGGATNSTKLLNNYKKASRRGSCSSLCTKRNVSFISNCNKPPIPIPQSHKSSSFITQSPLFALGV